MAEDRKLVQGLRAFSPNAGAPGFVKASIVITLNDLVKFGKENPDLLTEYNGQKQLKIQLLESKEGKLYFAVDNYKPAAKPIEDKKPDSLFEPVDDLPF